MTLPKQLEVNLQSVFNYNPSPIICQDAEGEIIAINQSAEELLKIPSTKKQSQRVSDLFPDFFDENEIKISYEKLPSNLALKAGKPIKNFVMGFYPENETSPVWLKTDVIPHFHNEEEKCQWFCIYFHDITKDKKTQDELKKDELKYRTLVDNMYSSMLIIQDSKIEFMNESLEKLLGYSKEEMLGTDYVNYIESKEKYKVKEFHEARINNNMAPEEYITKVMKKNGQPIFVNLKIKSILFNNKIETLVVLTDVDEQIRSEILLRESEEKFRSMVESINDGIVFIDNDGTILHINKIFSEIFETNGSEFIGKNAIELFKRFAQKNHYPRLHLFISGIAKRQTVPPIEIKYKNQILEFSVSRDLKANRLIGIVRNLTHQKETERELLIQSRRTNDALRGANLGTWEWNIQTGKMIFNERCVEMIGYSLVEASDWTIEKWRKHAHPDDVKKSERRMQAHFHRKKKYYECEMRMQHKNGNWIWVLEKGQVAIWSNEENPLLISGTQHDITDRKLAEVEIKESERRLATLMDNLPGLVYRCRNDKNWTMEFVSNGCHELTGYRPYDLVGQENIPYSSLIHHEDRDFVYKEVQKALKKSKAFEIEYRITTADGTEKIVWERGVGVYLNGQLQFIEGFIHDITADKKAEEILLYHEQLLRQIADNYPNSFVSILDKNLRVILCAGQEFKNQQLEPATYEGLQPEDLYGEKAIQIKEFYQHTFQGAECDFEMLISDKYYHFRTVPIKNENDIERILVVEENITDKKQMWNDLVMAKEKAEESDRLKSAFLTTMNHELRTPLNHVIGFSEIIRDTTSEDNIKQFAQTIFESGLGLLEIIEDIFDLALTEQNDIKIRLKTFSIEDLYIELKTILEELLVNAGKNDDVNLIFSPQKELLSRQMMSDKNKIMQVMINLFKNAVKFTESGAIKFAMYETDNNYLSFRITDTGVGIDKEKQDIIFEFFRQGDDTHTRRFGGVGVGLAISRKIAEAMDGNIKVLSEKGEGATFLFSVPLEY